MATTRPAAAAAGGAADVPDAQGLSQAAALVLRALQCSGSAAAAERYGREFGRWAQEGRPYRGQVFTTADVDAALGAYKRFVHSKVQEVQADFQSPRARLQAQELQKPEETVGVQEVQAECKKPQSTVRLCTLKAAKDSPWPTCDVVDASKEVAQHLGPQPRQINACVNLLPALHELASSAGAAAGDVRVRAADGLVYAHCKILSAASRFIQCKFDGRFNSGSRDVDAGSFRHSVVQAAVSFIYLGTCQVPWEDIHALFALADLWQVSEITAAVLSLVSEMPPIMCIKELAGWEDPGYSSSGLARFSAAFVQRAAFGFNTCAEKLVPLPRTSLVVAQAPRRVDDDDGWAKESRKVFAQLTEANAPVWLFVRELCQELEKLPDASVARLRSIWVTSGDDANDIREDQQDDADGVGELSSQPLAQALEKFFTSALGAGRREELRLLARLRLLMLPHFNALRVVRNVASAGGIVDESGAVWPWVCWTHASGLNFTQLWSYYNVLRRCPRRPTMPEATSLPDLLGGGGDHTDGDPLPEDLEKEFAMAFAGSLENDSAAAIRWESLLADDPHGIRWPAIDESMYLLARFIQSSPVRLSGLPPAGALRVLRVAVAALPSAAVKLSGADAQANAFAGLYCASKSSTLVSSSHKRRSIKAWAREGAAESSLVLRRVPRSPVDLHAVSREDLQSAERNLRFAWKGVPEEVLRTARTEWKIQLAEDEPYVDIPQALAFDEVQDPADISGPWWIFNSKLQKFTCRHGITVSREAINPVAAAPFLPALCAWAKHRAGCGSASDAVVSHLKELESCLIGAEWGIQHEVLQQLCRSAATSASNEAEPPQKPTESEAGKEGEPAGEQQVQEIHQGSNIKAEATASDGTANVNASVKDVASPQPAPKSQQPPQSEVAQTVDTAARQAGSAANDMAQKAKELGKQAGSTASETAGRAKQFVEGFGSRLTGAAAAAATKASQVSVNNTEPPARVRPRLPEEPPTKLQRTDSAGPPQAARQDAQRQSAHEAWARAFEASQKAHEEERAHYRRWRQASEAARRAREAEEAARQALDALGGA